MLGGGFELRAVDAARSLLALHQHLAPRARPLAVGAPAFPTEGRARCCRAPRAERMRAHLLFGLHNCYSVPYTRGIQLLHTLVCFSGLPACGQRAQLRYKARCEAAAARAMELKQAAHCW